MRFLAMMMLALGLATPGQAEVPHVVTDFGPIQSLVLQVMAGVGAPVALLPMGGDPHDFQSRPSQADLLAKADVVFWDGPELMPALGAAIASLAPQARVVALLHDGGGHIRSFAGGGIDPHAWTDPANGAAWLGTIASVLAARDPDHAATYATNAKSAQTALASLDAELTALLAPVRQRPFVVYHDALGYFTDHYGLTVAAAIELGDASGPTAARLSQVRDVLAASKAICVFPEVGRDPKFIVSLSDGLDVRVGAAQDVEFIQMPAGPGQYAAMLRNLAEHIAACLNQN